MMFQNLPKVELHLHLDGCLSFDLVREIRPGTSMEQYREEYIAPAKCRDLADFLKHTGTALELMQSAHVLRFATRDLCEQLREDGVRYAEIRFAPLLHLGGGLKAKRVVEVVEGALEDELNKGGLEARLILCTLKSFTEEESMETVRLVEEFKGSLVNGFDIAGYEANFPLDRHLSAFDFARQHGIPTTAHAGEAFGAESVAKTIDSFGVRRIGHGVRSIEDAKLLERLKEEGIHLEVCPSSNIQVNVFDTYADHPVDRLFREGISLGINTDNRTLTDLTLSREYEKLQETFSWGKEEFLQVNLNALEAAFLDRGKKDDLKIQFEKLYREP